MLSCAQREGSGQGHDSGSTVLMCTILVCPKANCVRLLQHCILLAGWVMLHKHEVHDGG